MCGLCGELSIDRSPADRSVVEAMSNVLAPRGPDDSGSWQGGLGQCVAFGHRRLSVIDLSNAAHQPMVDAATELTIVFNGAIYNYRELRKQLQARGHSFRSQGDTEVILKAYAEWGEDCPQHLHGMFAFAIWDEQKQQLFIARDRLGIKPLYYSLINSGGKQRFRFASSAPALLADKQLDRSLDTTGLHNLFSLHAVVPAPHTVLNAIRKLEPGHFMVIDGGTTQGRGTPSITPQRYWQLSAQPRQPELNQSEWVEATREALIRSVERRRTIADVPVGVLLSGGLDSSLLVGLLAEAGQTDLKTFSIGFEDSPEEKGSEFEYSDPVAERFATDHHRLLIPNSDVLPRLPEAVRHMSEPMFGQDAVAFYLLSEQVSQHVKVVQSGQGADEVFGGYFWYSRMAEAQGSDLSRFSQHYLDRDHSEFADMLDARWHGDDVTAKRLKQHFESTRQHSPDSDFLNRVLHLDVTTLVVDDPVKRVDNMTMAWGLEARVPFLDHQLVELAASMPSQWKLKDGGKYPLKAIARGLIPDAVIDRPKGYFPMPALKYVRGEFLGFMHDVLDSQVCRERGLYQRSYVEKMLAEPEQHHTRIMGSKLWHLTALELWLQTHVD